MKHLKTLSSLLIGAGFPLTQFTILLYTPALPFLRQYFNTTTPLMLFSMSLLMIGYMLGNIFWGTLSDYFGQRRTFLMALLCYAVVGFITIFATHFIEFCIEITLLGFIAGAFTSMGNAMMRSLHGKNKVTQIIAYIGIVMAVSPMIAPIIGSYLFQQFSWHAIYVFMTAYALILFISAFIVIKEPAHDGIKKQPLLAAFKTHFSNKPFLGHILSLALSFGCSIVLLEMLSFIFTQYLSIRLTSYAYLSLLLIAPYPIISIIGSKLVTPTRTKKLVRIGLLIAIMGTLGLLLLAILNNKSMPLTSLFIMLNFAGLGFIMPMNKAGAMSKISHNAGSASSIMKFVQSFGAVIITAINAHLHQATQLTNMAILLLISWVIAYLALLIGRQRI